MSVPNPDQYHADLLPLTEQIAALRRINEYYWQNYFSEEQIAAIPAYDTAQRLLTATSLHVEFDSPAQTLLMWRNAYFRGHWGMAHWNMIAVSDKDGGKDFLRLHESTKRYEPGIHIIEADLTYRFNDNANIDTVRSKAIEAGHYLAHGELLSIVGLHKGLRTPQGERGSYVWAYNPYLGGYENNDPWYAEQSPQMAWRWVPRFDTGFNPGEMGLRVFTASASRYGSVPRILDN